MAQGKKTTAKKQAEIIALANTGETLSNIARKTKTPVTTTKGIIDKYAEEHDIDFEQVRKEKMKEFLAVEYEILLKSQKAINRKLDNEASGQEQININSLNTVLGTAYDKIALEENKPTQIVNGSVEVKKFEDF